MEDHDYKKTKTQVIILIIKQQINDLNRSQLKELHKDTVSD